MSLPLQETIALPIPHGPLGAILESLPMDGGCIVISKTEPSSPLAVGDIIESVNDIALTDVKGGVPAWMDLFRAEGEAGPRTLIVRRQAAAHEARGAVAGMSRMDDAGDGGSSSANSSEGAVRAASPTPPTAPPSERWRRSVTRDDPSVGGTSGDSSVGETAAERWLRETETSRRRERESLKERGSLRERESLREGEEEARRLAAQASQLDGVRPERMSEVESQEEKLDESQRLLMMLAEQEAAEAAGRLSGLGEGAAEDLLEQERIQELIERERELGGQGEWRDSLVGDPHAGIGSDELRVSNYSSMMRNSASDGSPMMPTAVAVPEDDSDDSDDEDDDSELERAEMGGSHDAIVPPQRISITWSSPAENDPAEAHRPAPSTGRPEGILRPSRIGERSAHLPPIGGAAEQISQRLQRPPPVPQRAPDPKVPWWRTLQARTAAFYLLCIGVGCGLGLGVHRLILEVRSKNDTARTETIVVVVPRDETNGGTAAPSAAPSGIALTSSPIVAAAGSVGGSAAAPSYPSRSPLSSTSPVPNLMSSSASNLMSSPTAMPSSTPTVKQPMSIVEAIDPSLINGGGAPATLHSFTLTAEGIPAQVGQVRFEWTPGYGAGGSAAARVSDGRAAVTIQLFYPRPGSYEIDSWAYDGQTLLTTSSLRVQIAGTTLIIDPPGPSDAQLSKYHTFNLIADDVPKEVSAVRFVWTMFGLGGQSYKGDSGIVPTSKGRAKDSISGQLTRNGTYGLAVNVLEVGSGAVLARGSATTIVRPIEERNQTLDSCGDWVARKDGKDFHDGGASKEGDGSVAIDDWDISAVPHSAVFDVRYAASTRNLLVEYPIDNDVFDLGWRVRLDGTGGNGRTAMSGNIFSRLTHDTFRVTFVTPDLDASQNRERGYQVRCRTPRLNDDEACTEDLDCPSGACAHSFFGPDSQNVCCASGYRTIYTRRREGWNSNELRDFCTDQLNGFPCGKHHELCASGTCLADGCA